MSSNISLLYFVSDCLFFNKRAAKKATADTKNMQPADTNEANMSLVVSHRYAGKLTQDREIRYIQVRQYILYLLHGELLHVQGRASGILSGGGGGGGG